MSRVASYSAAVVAMVVAAPAQAALPADPLGSPMWQRLGKSLFGDAPVRFDPRVRVIFPDIAENQRQFPVAIDARGIVGVKRILLFADLNPIPLAVDYTLGAAQPYFSTRIKLDQRTPVRGAVQLADGSWLVSGGWIDAAGGGCSLPPISRVKGDWAQHLGEVRGVARRVAGATRVRLAFRHPMDTGLIGNIPTYNLEEVVLTGAEGRRFGDLRIEASVAEDPEFALIVDALPGEEIAMAGRDTNGIDYAARLMPTTVAAPR
ncbi:quinoprotein dehydrogenase-associated SoxYZ-like carrier [Sphingomonas mali]|uniref:quinoprotein dehydrogenase-associated SoxYZ-like carrier n=1 Tax=Sphingomonas mali TaxID=40682 RepID=UPI0008317FB2|nr:quinoprotein dehydrogenase-associated SoxYZ-like carrier [Sphingomonas mali]